MSSTSIAKDVQWHMLSWLPAREIENSRRVCREWRDTVDAATQSEWRDLFRRQVRVSLCVSSMFDWRRAAVCATSARRAVVAVCLWKGAQRIRIVVPWTSEDAPDAVDAPLRVGVRRQFLGTNVEYIYDDMFRLRGLYRSCLHRQARSPCRNCDSRSKQKCLAPQYDYYLSNLTGDLVALDEYLGFRLVQTANAPIGTTFAASTSPDGKWYITTTGRTPNGSTVERT